MSYGLWLCLPKTLELKILFSPGVREQRQLQKFFSLTEAPIRTAWPDRRRTRRFFFAQRSRRSLRKRLPARTVGRVFGYSLLPDGTSRPIP